MKNKNIHSFNKRGMELSMGILVLLIISIIIFSYSLYFLYDIWKGVAPIEAELDQYTQQAIEQMLNNQAELVAIPFHSKTAKIGETAVYWMGVRNVENTAKNFKVSTKFSKAFTLDGRKELEKVDERKMNEWLGNSEEFEIGKISAKQYETAPLGITVGDYSDSAQQTTTQSGIYIFEVCVFHTQGECYGGKQEVNVKVE
ncbi:hypothetical protein HZA97_05745 [Candidatus Woesearchaeota archaeon]|nr:hypothetical protein [Candidatus Woesearchaeota archaeon]